MSAHFKTSAALTEKVTIRCSKEQKKQIKEILRRNPNTKEAELLRYLLDAVLETAERKGLAGVLSLRDAARRQSPMETIDLPLFTGRLPEPDLKVAEGGTYALAPEDSDGIVPVPNRGFPAHAIAFTVPNEDVSGAGLHQGDVVVIDLEAVPRDGDLVVAERGGSILLRKLRKKGDKLSLEVQHPEYSETWVPKVPGAIRGVVLGPVDA